MSRTILSEELLRRALAVTDLTDPEAGPHALQCLVRSALDALCGIWQCELVLDRQSPIVSVADNYDRLHYPPDGAARAARYTRYVSEDQVLRTQTSAMIPALLRRLADRAPNDLLLACAGLVYRRDAIDRLHSAEPHQLDLWRVSKTLTLGRHELQEMIACVLSALLPGRQWRATPAVHPYTLDGLQLDVYEAGQWIEIGECGRALPLLLAENGHPAPATGLAMGLGLDRILMLRKGIDDLRLVRSSDPRVQRQMRDLAPYLPVSAMPSVRRDLSLAVAADADVETLGDGVREALAERAEMIEAIEVLSETPYGALPPAAISRMGLSADQKNVLLRVTLRALDRTLTHAECNELRDAIYKALHRGARSEWAARGQ